MAVKSAQPTLQLPRFRSDQWRIVSHPAKTKICVMGRRWGKTVMGGAVALGTASAGGKAAWVVPTYRNSTPLWRWIESSTQHLVKARMAKVNRSDRVVSFSNGGFLGVYTADNPTGILGESFHLVVVDEAARIDEAVYYETIRPTLADYDGDAILISTPKGKNWFYVAYQQALITDGMASFHAPTSDNPNPNIKAAAELARERLSERAYRQEWLAQFLDDGGEVFRRVRDAVYGRMEGAHLGGQYVVGVDIGRTNDYTVFCVLDVVTRRVVEMERFTGIELTQQLGRLTALAERIRPQSILIESNFSQKFVEDAVRANLPVVPFHTSNASKQILVDGLAGAFERGSIGLPDEPILIAELESFGMERLPSGLIRYTAPSGLHDDTVIALALAWHGAELSGAVFGSVVRF